jgi:hypothetical protein
MRATWLGLLAVLAGLVGFAGHLRAVADDVAAPSEAAARQSTAAILDTTSFWRVRAVWETPEVLLPSGQTHHARVDVEDHLGHYQTDRVEMIRLPAETPPDWMKPAFDDSAWVRLRGPILDRTVSECWKPILMRGRFEIADPAEVGDLILSLTFRGGAVAYLNGEEIAWASMPDGQARLYTLAAPHPEEARPRGDEEAMAADWKDQ